MNKKIYILASSAIFSANAFAYDAPEVFEAKMPETPILEYTTHAQDRGMENKVEPRVAPKIASTYVSAKYLTVNEDFDTSGFEVGLGTSIYDVEVAASYRGFESSLDHVPNRPIDDVKQLRASVLLPLLVADDYSVHAGVGYAYTETKATQIKNNSAFGTLKVAGLISESIISYGAIDFEIYEDDVLLSDGSQYDTHDSATFRFGLDYFPTKNLAIGTSMSFGSELDSTFALQFSYHI